MVDFRGKYEHTIDDRGRVSLPARYRNEFAEKIILLMSEDGCIEVYTEAGFNEVASHTAVEPPTTRVGRRARRGFYSDSYDILEETLQAARAASSAEQAPED